MIAGNIAPVRSGRCYSGSNDKLKKPTLGGPLIVPSGGQRWLGRAHALFSVLTKFAWLAEVKNLAKWEVSNIWWQKMQVKGCSSKPLKDTLSAFNTAQRNPRHSNCSVSRTRNGEKKAAHASWQPRRTMENRNSVQKILWNVLTRTHLLVFSTNIWSKIWTQIWPLFPKMDKNTHILTYKPAMYSIRSGNTTCDHPPSRWKALKTQLTYLVAWTLFCSSSTSTILHI